jgi:hypothetical protein
MLILVFIILIIFVFYFLAKKNLISKFIDFLFEICNNIFFTNSEFELGNINDLSFYSFNDLCILIKNLNKGFIITKHNESSNTFLAEFKSKKTILIIRYSSDGIFLKKVNEELL